MKRISLLLSLLLCCAQINALDAMSTLRKMVGEDAYIAALDMVDAAVSKIHPESEEETTPPANPAGPNVICEVKEGENYVLKNYAQCLLLDGYKEEVSLLKDFLTQLADTLPENYITKHLGPVNLRKEAKEQTFMVLHSLREETTKYLGCGPEDDPFYNYKESDYYPAGTIKINLTERSYQLIKVYFERIIPRYGASSPQARGTLGYLTRLLGHEAMHGWQFKQKSGLNFKKYDIGLLRQEIAARNINKEVFDGTILMVNYEEDAVSFSNIFMAGIADDFESAERLFADWCKEADFLKDYPLLDESFYVRYMAARLADAKAVKEKMLAGTLQPGFGIIDRFTYLGQSVPLETFTAIAEINNAVDSGDPCGAYRNKVQELYANFADISIQEYPRDYAAAKESEEIKKTIVNIQKYSSGLPDIVQGAKDEFEHFYSKCK